MRIFVPYEVCIVAAKSGGITSFLGAVSLRHAQQVIAEARAENPRAHMIFLRRYQQRKGRETYVVLHKYTVRDGRTADERRAAAVAEVTHA